MGKKVKNIKPENAPEKNADQSLAPENEVEIPIKNEMAREGELLNNETEHQKARQEIEAMDVDDSLKTQLNSNVATAQSLDDKKKLDYLFKLAQSKGVVFAVNVAKKMNDPYVLDTFHDKLAREGYYKSFLK